MAETNAAPTGDAAENELESVRDEIVSWFDTWGDNCRGIPLKLLAQLLLENVLPLLEVRVE